MTEQAPPPLLDRELFSISQVNRLPDEERQSVYRRLAPLELLRRFGIDPETLADGDGHVLFKFEPGPSWVEFYLYHAWDAPDPVLYLQLADTPNNQIEVILLVLNDPTS